MRVYFILAAAVDGADGTQDVQQGAEVDGQRGALHRAHTHHLGELQSQHMPLGLLWGRKNTSFGQLDTRTNNLYMPEKCEKGFV